MAKNGSRFICINKECTHKQLVVYRRASLVNEYVCTTCGARLKKAPDLRIEKQNQLAKEQLNSYK